MKLQFKTSNEKTNFSNYLPSCKISLAVLKSKEHLSWWFMNRATVSKHRFLKGEKMLLIICHRNTCSSSCLWFMVYVPFLSILIISIWRDHYPNDSNDEIKRRVQHKEVPLPNKMVS